MTRSRCAAASRVPTRASCCPRCCPCSRWHGRRAGGGRSRRVFCPPTITPAPLTAVRFCTSSTRDGASASSVPPASPHCPERRRPAPVRRWFATQPARKDRPSTREESNLEDPQPFDGAVSLEVDRSPGPPRAELPRVAVGHPDLDLSLI